MDVAWAEGAVIISDDGNRVKYRQKCPYCGNVPYVDYIVGLGNLKNYPISRPQCSKCGKQFAVVLHRG